VEGLICPGIIIFIIGSYIWNAITGSDDSPAVLEYQQSIDKGLTLTTSTCDFSDPNEDPLLGVELFVEGTIEAGGDNLPVDWVVTIRDMEGDEEHAILCAIADYSEDDCYFFTSETELPYHVTIIEEPWLVTSIPLFALVGPKKGDRIWEINAFIFPRGNRTDPLSFGTLRISHSQTCVGYTEHEAHSRQQDENIAALAVSMAAADGRVSKREMAIIKSFFAQRVLAYSDVDHRKAALQQTMTDTLRKLQGGTTTKSLIVDYCREFRDSGDTECCIDAYRLCAQVAAADDVIELREENALRFIAKQLKIDEELVNEIHDVNIKIHMYDVEKMPGVNRLGMPIGLSLENQQDWLTQEYRKWRKRQGSSNPETANDATERCQLISDCLGEVDTQLEQLR